ncbi:MAG: FHA domain-containing protein, partial [Gammaproteobacteria bacterium]|nr:FHA domain-containing protein [Gammaproteobacteria bacterium]
MSSIYRKTIKIAFILAISMPVIAQEDSGIDAADTETVVSSNIQETDNINNIDTGVQPVSPTIADTQPVTNHDIVVLWAQSDVPQESTTRQVLSILSSLGPSTHVGVMGFIEQVSVIQSLITSNELDQQAIQNALLTSPGEGAAVDLGRALERGIYELKYNGRQTADKVIILITNPGEGGIQSGGMTLPLTVGTDISEFDISLVGITFSEMAMNNLSQALNGLQNTAIHMIQNIDELNAIIQSLLSTSPSSESAQTTPSTFQQTLAEIPQGQPVQSQAQVNSNTSIVSPAVGEEEKTRNIIIVIAAGILIITMGALITLLYFRMKKLSGGGKVEVSEAFLKDIHGYTSNELYRLGNKATMLGRVAGKDSEELDFIVIPETTIGRRHAVIEYKDYAYWIMDQGSINGTFVNNILVTSEVRLKQGDIIRLHKFEFEFNIPE